MICGIHSYFGLNNSVKTVAVIEDFFFPLNYHKIGKRVIGEPHWLGQLEAREGAGSAVDGSVAVPRCPSCPWISEACLCPLTLGHLLVSLRAGLLYPTSPGGPDFTQPLLQCVVGGDGLGKSVSCLLNYLCSYTVYFLVRFIFEMCFLLLTLSGLSMD